jgi:EAL domain-containing protein (putative c-di-GMP-specific phosphodiesterase class I)
MVRALDCPIPETIRAKGCTFALDDVGAGFNSFNDLRLPQFDTIKIDGQYVRNLERDPVDSIPVRGAAAASASCRRAWCRAGGSTPVENITAL